MSVANVDDVRRNVRAAIRRHWVLFLVPGVVMAILGLLAAASPFMATLVLETFAGWLFLTSGFVGLAALFTTRSVPGSRAPGQGVRAQAPAEPPGRSLTS